MPRSVCTLTQPTQHMRRPIPFGASLSPPRCHRCVIDPHRRGSARDHDSGSSASRTLWRRADGHLERDPRAAEGVLRPPAPFHATSSVERTSTSCQEMARASRRGPGDAKPRING